jgi:hypothetical protein
MIRAAGGVKGRGLRKSYYGTGEIQWPAHLRQA